MSEQRVIVIGGGASGMMAAITAASKGAKVTVLEQNDRIGKKLAATGNGRCNLTNLNFIPEETYRSEDMTFVLKAFEQYSVSDSIDFFESLGIFLQNKNGYLYPRSGQAKTIVSALNSRAVQLKVKIKTNESAVQIVFDASTSCWTVKTQTWHYEGDSIILANGSCASLISGSDGSGYQLAREIGLSVVPPLPALCPLKCKGVDFKQWAGVRTEGIVHLFIDQHEICSDRGELQLTEYGISGIPVFQISRYAARALHEKKSVAVVLDFMPELSRDSLYKKIEQIKTNCPGKSLAEILEGILPDKLARMIAKQKNPLDMMKEFHLRVVSDMGVEKAQVCSGGVDVKQIDPISMEAKHYPGLHVIGELLDVDGICGGYNLQWAWTSGYLAGKHAAE